MKIAVLGPGCANCRTLEERTREAVTQLGLTAQIEHVTDPGEIASWGIMRTPGLVVDGAVVVSGRVPATAQIAELLQA